MISAIHDAMHCQRIIQRATLYGEYDNAKRCKPVKSNQSIKRLNQLSHKKGKNKINII